MARVGYGKVAAARGLHPSGFEEVLVHKADHLDSLDPERQAVRIGSSVGNRKRSRIHNRADELGLRVLNRRQIDKRGDL
jgi:large subunit ribosomal protein L32e